MFRQKITLLFVACFFLSACSGIKSNNGYMPVKNSVDQLKVNETSSSDAKSKLGEPSLILGNEEPMFIYSSQITNRVLFFEPKVIARNVLILYFNKKQKLKRIEKFTLKDGKSFDINTNNTVLNAEQRSFISTFFSNIGIGGTRISD